MGKDFSVSAYTAPTNVYMAMGSQYAGECTTYAWGRAYEKWGIKTLPNAAAGSWYSKATNFSKGQIPYDNSIACFSGHVVYVERVSGDGKTIYFTEANWYNNSYLSDGKWQPAPTGTDGESKSMGLEAFKLRSGKTAFQGFIYLR